MSNFETIIEAIELRKTYGRRLALDALSLTVRAGEIVGLLGPNGAGKTTTLSILATTLRPDSGRAQVCGQDLISSPARARRSLGLVPQTVGLYPTLTAAENLEFFGRMQGMGSPDARSAARQALEAVGLEDRAGDRVAAFSGGMKRRLNLACGILHRPAALLLDEPTLGVDPQSRERIFGAVRVAAERGAAILYSTNYMEEAERLCDRVILIDYGRIVAHGTPMELVARFGGRPRLDMVTRRELPLGWSATLNHVDELPREPGAVRASVSLSSLEQVPALLGEAQRIGGEVLEFQLHRPNLQEAFIALTGHRLRDSD